MSNDAEDLNHIPYEELTPEQQEARKLGRAALVEEAKRISREIDFRSLGTVRGLRILKEEEADGWIAGQVWDGSDLSKTVLLSLVHPIALHFLGLSAEQKAERESINKFLALSGEELIEEPSVSFEDLEAAASELHDAIVFGEQFEYGTRIVFQESACTLNLVMKNVPWDNDEAIQIILLESDEDFNLIIDYIS